jgi:hypothetical protein
MHQEETVKIVDPLRDYMTDMGWYVKKMHGSQFQAGFPDLWCCHSRYEPRLIECKIEGRPFTRAQIIEFPKMIMHGAKIWLIEGTDFRGPNGKEALLRAYQKLFKDPNCVWYLHPDNRRLKI